MKSVWLWLAWLSLIPGAVTGQEVEPDVQFRFPTHIQATLDKTTGNGLALWSVLPDVTAKRNGGAMLFVGGALFQDEKSNWLELMGGARYNQDGYIDPLFNVRFQRTMGEVRVFIETQNTFRKERRRVLSWMSLTVPTGLWGIRAGIESENLNFFGKLNFFGIQDSWGVGPEVIAPLPIPLPDAMKFSVAATYHFRTDRDIFRIYVANTIKVP